MIWEENVFIKKDESLAQIKSILPNWGISRLHKVMVIDPKEVIYVMFSISPKHFFATNIYSLMHVRKPGNLKCHV